MIKHLYIILIYRNAIYFDYFILLKYVKYIKQMINYNLRLIVNN